MMGKMEAVEEFKKDYSLIYIILPFVRFYKFFNH